MLCDTLLSALEIGGRGKEITYDVNNKERSFDRAKEGKKVLSHCFDALEHLVVDSPAHQKSLAEQIAVLPRICHASRNIIAVVPRQDISSTHVAPSVNRPLGLEALNFFPTRRFVCDAATR